MAPTNEPPNNPPNKPPFKSNPRLAEYKADLAMVEANFVPKPTDEQLRARHIEYLKNHYSEQYPDAYKHIMGSRADRSSDWLDGAPNNPFADELTAQEATDPVLSIAETLRRFHNTLKAAERAEYYSSSEQEADDSASQYSDEEEHDRTFRSAAPSPSSPVLPIPIHRFETLAPAPPNTPVNSPPKRAKSGFQTMRMREFAAARGHAVSPAPPNNTPVNSLPKESYIPGRGRMSGGAEYASQGTPRTLTMRSSGDSCNSERSGSEMAKENHRGEHGHTHEVAVREGRPPWAVSGMWVPPRARDNGEGAEIDGLHVEVEEKKGKRDKKEKRGVKLRDMFRNSRGE